MLSGGGILHTFFTCVEHCLVAEAGASHHALHVLRSFVTKGTGAFKSVRPISGTARVHQELEGHASDRSERKEARFIDKLRITAQAGRGGSGCISFYQTRGRLKSPDGGNGGDGGDVILQACRRVGSLGGLNHLHKAFAGSSGRKQKAAGSRGMDCIIKLPVGTVVYLPEARPAEMEDLPAWILRPREPWVGSRDSLSEEEDYSGEADAPQQSSEELQKQRLGWQVADLARDDQQYVLARGGQGGHGNAFQRSRAARDQGPKPSAGGAGERVTAILEVRIFADVGLVGAPNAGKSSLLRALSAASPKVAPYPFTSLQPNLGSVRCGRDVTLTLADIPGLIPGAALNRGLGHAFLRHVSRAQALVYVLDASSGLGTAKGASRPWHQLQSLQRELRLYSPALLEKPALIVANKVDKLRRPMATIRALQRRTRLPVLPTAAVKQPLGMTRLREELAALAGYSSAQ